MLKKLQIIDIIAIFTLSFLFHFLYESFPIKLFSIFFSVNESIWEHMKLIITPFYVVGIFDIVFLYYKKIKVNNFLLQLFIVPIIGIILYLIIYLPVYHLIGENMIVSIILLFLIIVIEKIISYKLLTYKEIKYQSIIGALGIIITYIIFGYLTYKPFYNELFYDKENDLYGINTYVK